MSPRAGFCIVASELDQRTTVFRIRAMRIRDRLLA
jgi:hypothetical protein